MRTHRHVVLVVSGLAICAGLALASEACSSDETNATGTDAATGTDTSTNPGKDSGGPIDSGAGGDAAEASTGTVTYTIPAGGGSVSVSGATTTLDVAFPASAAGVTVTLKKSTPASIGGASEFTDVITMAPDGTTSVAFLGSASGGFVPDRVYVATRTSSSAFGAPESITLSTGPFGGVGVFLEPDIASAWDGTVQLVWPRFDAAHNYVIQTAARAPGQSFSIPLDLSSPGATSDDPRIAVSPVGQAAAIWTQNVSGHLVVEAKVTTLVARRCARPIAKRTGRPARPCLHVVKFKKPCPLGLGPHCLRPHPPLVHKISHTGGHG